MKLDFQLRHASYKNQVFWQGFLEYLYNEEKCSLRDAQQAGIERLEEIEESIAPSTITSWSRQLRFLGVYETRRNRRKYFAVLTDDQDVLHILDEFINE